MTNKRTLMGSSLLLPWRGRTLLSLCSQNTLPPCEERKASRRSRQVGKRIQNTEWRALGGGAREIEVSAATLRARQLFQPSTFLPPATLCASQLVSVGPSKADVVLLSCVSLRNIVTHAPRYTTQGVTRDRIRFICDCTGYIHHRRDTSGDRISVPLPSRLGPSFD